jgi:serine/threonine protein kinase
VGARDFAGNQRFEVLTRLGRGGMGTVYQVVDHARKARVALKTVGQVKGDALLRFKREFRALSEINHPNIIELGELLEQDGEWFFTMELIAGTEFLQFVRPHADESGEYSRDSQPSFASHDGLLIRPGSRLDLHPVALGGIGFDEGALRRSMGQLAEALHALHQSGHVHRDIKPSNVLITSEGRVVVIDFGLVTGPRSTLSTEMHVLGTVAYMSPEQAAGQAVGPESDWYSVGAMLYEALTGRLPIEGNGLTLLMRKQTEVPPRPRELVAGVPDDLDALCMELLRVDPAQRPRERAILERLHVEVSKLKRASITISIGERGDEFVGRAEELAFLDAELARVRAGEQRIVTLLSESGLGKSALLRRFSQRVEAEDSRALVLSGRCYEQESVPYKALDAVMDQLSRWLKRLPAEQSSQLLPDDVALLEHTFPVLSRVPAIARRRRDRVEVKDAQQRRLLVMRSLRALFDALARHVPVVMVIDDFQWSDQDSLRMLAQLTGPPNPPPLLLVFASRSDDEEPILRQGTCLKLAPLSGAHSLELALSMTRHLGQGSPEQAALVARQAEGSPFLIEALLHQIGATTHGVSQDLEQLIAGSIQALDEPARRLFEVVCLAGFPITQQLAAEASGLEPAELIQRLRALRVSRLVRTSGPLNTDTVEPYHNRVREAVARSLPAAQREAIHDALARALEAHHGEPQRIAYHLRCGGEPMRAAGYLIAAAQRALDALAFDRAAIFYLEAVSVGQLSDDERRRLLAARGHALACAGRGRAAAEAFAEAIPGSSATTALELRRRIAEQLLNAGYYREGIGACNAFVEGLGIHFPKNPRRVFFDLLLTNFWLWLRGLRSRVRERDQLSQHEVSRVDAYWAMAKGFASYDPIRAQLFQARGLLTALGAGEPYRLSRSIALSGFTAVVLSPAARARADARLSMARQLAERSNNPHALGFIALMQGMVEYIGHCRWRRALDRLGPAEAYLRASCEDVAWEIDQCSGARWLCLYWLGEWQRLIAAAPEACKEGEARGNRYALVFTHSQWMSFARALAGDFAGARREIDDYIDATSKSTSPVEAVMREIAHLRVDLCEGAVDQALARLDQYRPGLIERLTLRTSVIRTAYEAAAINVLLAAACAARGKAAQRLYGRVRRRARALVRKGIECTAPLAALALAAVQAAHADREGALSLLADAEAGFEAEGMMAHVAAARLRRGQLLGGDKGRNLMEAGEQFLVQQGAGDIQGVLRLLAAGFPAEGAGA